ncbi:MAG: helix-turn-helix transcriptional regulator [Longimicrobiales bacterium]
MADSTKQRTRSRVIDQLRQGPRTVDQLAMALGLTDNAIRVHLSALEQEGVVRQEGVRRSGSAGKPAVIYNIAPEAEVAFSRVYAPVLGTLVDSLGERLTRSELEQVFREVGRRLGEAQTAPTGNLAKRVRTVSALLNQLGALTTVEADNGHVVLRGSACPLSVAVSRRHEVCLAVEELLVVLTGARVERQCRYHNRPACQFQLSELDRPDNSAALH